MAQTSIQNVKFDEKGTIPAVIQDVGSSEVLGLFYMDNDSLMRTLKTGEAWINLKHESPSRPFGSPHRLVDVRVNADGDSLTVLVETQGIDADNSNPVSLLQGRAEVQKASAGEVSLVAAGSMELGIAINELYNLIMERKDKRPEGSYTTYLFNSGLDKILKKIAEEAGEVIIASKNNSSRDLVSELSDLFYHLLVLMVDRGIKLSDVHGELSRRANSSKVHVDIVGSQPSTDD